MPAPSDQSSNPDSNHGNVGEETIGIDLLRQGDGFSTLATSLRLYRHAGCGGAPALRLRSNHRLVPAASSSATFTVTVKTVNKQYVDEHPRRKGRPHPKDRPVHPSFAVAEQGIVPVYGPAPPFGGRQRPSGAWDVFALRGL